MHTDTLIIGGGLAGLSLASRLTDLGHSYILAEARDRLGGRIAAVRHEGATYDMGPAWFWPGQPRIAKLIGDLGLRRFDQYAQGDLMFEDAQGQPQRGQGFSSMQGSYRLEGGLIRLIERLSEGVPASNLHLSSAITALTEQGDIITAKLQDGRTITAGRAVLALPPRLAAQITYAPTLPGTSMQAMHQTATWMAGHAKAVAIYDRPFWREAGLSGDAMSLFGPMAEVHDASPAQGGPYALFGFLGVPPQARANEHALRQHILSQLTRLFGAQAASPVSLSIKDWAFDPFTANAQDQQPLYAHPDYGLPAPLSGLWDGKLILGGTEVAPEFGGYLEGALEAAENALRLLTRPER
ncbi:FAD-dependent oxidoreductase [Lentibacter algarum]|uniref:flavin monoamine oxidase family protein n=1 Tax=Lentibacter algarum TaxID=576131 RepID=UPI001C077E42|nr:FAD-dependent oxidoreductase [Lentibacter algarum]MBU2980625.1 FAD-dependent oxidoreductase [Lentibacter algarum]